MAYEDDEEDTPKLHKDGPFAFGNAEEILTKPQKEEAPKAQKEPVPPKASNVKATGVVIRGVAESVPGLTIINYFDEAVLKLRDGNDVRPRNTRWVRSIVIHTTKGIWPQVIKPGLGPFMDIGEKVAKYWTTSPDHAGAHLVVDFDGAVTCHCDLLLQAAYHAGAANEYSIGIEIYQGKDGRMYEDQLAAVVKLIDWLTARFGIQRQMPAPDAYGLIQRMALGGKNVVGIYGHRAVTHDRGRGDPGDHIFDRLLAAGYEVYDFNKSVDRAVWKDRQVQVMGIDKTEADGLPGLETRDALRFKGYKDGLWVSRP